MSHLRKVKVVFLPPNCTSQLQPLDAGVIKCMKQKYRKFLVQRRLAGMERKQLDKKLSVLDAMHCIASAWDAVTPETIVNSFRHCGFNRSGACSTSEAAVPVDDEPEFGSLELPGSFADYVGADDDVAVCSEVSLDDIIKTVRPAAAETSNEEEMDDAAEASAPVPTYADVLCYVDHIRRFACARDEIGDLLPDVAAIERKLMRPGWPGATGVVAAGIAARRRGVVTSSRTMGADRSECGRDILGNGHACDLRSCLQAGALVSVAHNQRTCRCERHSLAPTVTSPLRFRD
ncbi:hypothetical protein HPB52_002567 [Rhipicephalus sanguineus]|uniref:DDE-1 domain-containing protein n=1 Tax=Rhipicephalus sanguineus TaxID=34632 RepID=A0A9D4PBG5_RHISA|nr:hypothetical protein HPB52_002567 [Rhipicephalus sanguineus]